MDADNSSTDGASKGKGTTVVQAATQPPRENPQERIERKTRMRPCSQAIHQTCNLVKQSSKMEGTGAVWARDFSVHFLL